MDDNEDNEAIEMKPKKILQSDSSNNNILGIGGSNHNKDTSNTNKPPPITGG